MDRIQQLTIAALFILTAVTLTMLTRNHLYVKNTEDSEGGQSSLAALQIKYDRIMAENKILYAEVDSFLQQKQYGEADKKLTEIESSSPDNPQSLLYRAELLYSQGRVADAISSYRVAVHRSPDYVDRKTPLFVGDKIMKIIEEARGKLAREKKLKPGDKTVALALEDIDYLQRRIAGGCE